MQVLNRKKSISEQPGAYGKYAAGVSIVLKESEDKMDTFEINVPKGQSQDVLIVQWKMKAIGIKGVWTSNNIMDKRFRTDWEMPKLKSSISVDAPVVSLFGYNDENIVTVGCSDLVNLIHIEASLREEDNHFYFKFHFFVEREIEGDYNAKLRIDKTKVNFSAVVQSCSDWMVQENQIQVRNTPPLAITPLYSTWYSFHQSLDEDELIEECRLSKNLGYGLVVVDDGWQTLDDGRGYDYTGDWRPERLSDMKGLVKKIHDLDMGIMLWYSVPFCGVKSSAYTRFKGKFLTENHHWAPVFDPRFPEVRSYLVGLYSQALLDWDLDGFKLDFIDDFKVYPETEVEELNGRDTLSVAQGTEKLCLEIAKALTTIKPDVLIEFRQQYINPALRQLGNMFRAFDCPNDSLMNRVRTTDVKLLCGTNAVHSDMLTWHPEEPVEVAALQFSSILFSVPQLSVRVKDRSDNELAMIKFYTMYWSENRDVLLGGNFEASKPMSNYAILKASIKDKIICGVYEDVVLDFETQYDTIHIVNGKMSDTIILKVEGSKTSWKRKVVDCMGNSVLEDTLTIASTLYHMECPPNGMIYLTKN